MSKSWNGIMTLGFWGCTVSHLNNVQTGYEYQRSDQAMGGLLVRKIATYVCAVL